MSSIDRPTTAIALRAVSPAAILAVFAATLFLSATLLFSVQPLFTKMVLPLLGGSPGAWSVAMVFFQGVLLLGYAYAHLLTRWTSPRIAVVLHLAVFALALSSLPLAVATGFGKPPANYEAFWLIGLFAISIGLPFFAVAANAPLLQAWFACTGHPQARDPYFLYGASNLGSFCALLAYPVLLEPLLTLRAQSSLWSAGFVLLMLMIVAAGALLALTRHVTSDNSAQSDTRPAWKDRPAWTGLAFVPSALLIAVTSHISTDIAAAPFLWVVPLALFLLTFVVTFRSGGDALYTWMVRLQPIVLAPLVIGLLWGERAYWMVAIALNLGTFVLSTMICHRRLYLQRQQAGHLTEFYMWISVGGVLGGIFAGLLAPYLFPDVWEYPILLVLALLCRPGMFAIGARRWLIEGGIIAAIIAVVLIPRLVFGFELSSDAVTTWMLVLIVVATVIMLQREHPVRLVGLTALVLIVTAIYQPGFVHNETARSFFGVHKVVESYDGRFRMLQHGTTVHGAQRIRDDAGNPVAGRPEPLTYYYARSPLAEVIGSMRESKGTLQRVALVGLGTGSLACHSRAGESWTYYEIDPVVVRLARDPTKFNFLSDCAPQADVVLGDARLTLADAQTPFDLIVLDAFSSDVVPVHLLTGEALSLYVSKLAPGGAIAFHISNRYLELASVVAAGARNRNLAAAIKYDVATTGEDYTKNMYARSVVAVIARSEDDLARFGEQNGWMRKTPSAGAWTDDYSNILAAIWRMQAGR